MATAMRLEVRQAQSLALTPQLLQSIRLLQYDPAELGAYLARESERNPLLLVRDRSGPSGGASRTRRVDAADIAAGLAAPERPSLVAHALAEIAEILPETADRSIAEALLVELDEAGYLRIDEITAALQLGAAPDRVAQVLERLRSAAEPAGLFARDLAECLALQLERRGRLDPVMRAVLARLDLVARRDVAALQRLTGEDHEGVAAIVAELRRLDPRPGRRFDGDGPGTITPEIAVTANATGGWRVSLTAGALPRVAFDETAARDLAAGCRSEGERAFLDECRSSAGWLARALDQRARSILKVAGEIVRRQEAFFREGADGLRPMTLAAVAEAVGLHESTVSRVVANKYMATPRGTLPLRFFFSAALSAANGGEAHSASSVRERIRRLIAAERPEAVLSDEEIAALLRRDGVEVARRTVAKYREGLGLGSSAQRRREARLTTLAS